VDVIAIAELALEQARSRVPFLGEVVRQYDPRAGRFELDPDQMLALFSNLIGNALEAITGSPACGAGRLVLGLSIRQEAASSPSPGLGGDSILGEALGVAAGQRELVIAVEDSGPGVPEPLRQRIFDPFFTTKECGTGVGLAAVQKIALSHGGSLELESPPGGGARFRVRLPDPAGRSDA
jgi:signal transduction histidine kinase